MRTLTFKCVVTSSMVSFVDLQGQHVPLSQSGNTWGGSLAVVLDTTLNIAATITGITGSPWTVDITADCAGGAPAKIFSRSGSIPDGGSEGFRTSKTIAPDPCNPKGEAAMDASVKMDTPAPQKAGKSKNKKKA